MLVSFEYSQGYCDALRDIKSWFFYHDEYLKDLRISRKALFPILDAFIKYDKKFMEDKAEFDFYLKPIKTGYDPIYRMIRDDEFEIANKIGMLFLKSLKGKNK